VAHEYSGGDRNQPFLLPPDTRDRLPEDHLVRFVIDPVSRLDPSAFHRLPTDPRGRRRHDPAVLVAVLVHACCVGERSSRRIERRCREDVAARVASANLTPDHTTPSRFLGDHAEAFDSLFVQVLRVAAAAGTGRVGTIHLDSTRTGADASPLAARTRDELLAEVRRVTEEARRTDEAEDALFGDSRGDELPAGMADPASRRARPEEALRRVEEAEAADAARPPSRRGRRPPRADVTDPECRVVKGPRGFFPGCNAHAVASDDGLLPAADVTDEPTDNGSFGPVVDQACANAAAAGTGPPRTACADSGHRDDRVGADADPGPGRPEPLVVPPRNRHRRRLATRGPVPRGATPARVMERKLATRRGSAAYRRRAAVIEPIFGHIKAAGGLTRFRRRGLAAARHQWRLVATTHNVLKLWRHRLAVA
jgi:transposase